MQVESLAAALEREHREIDAGIEAFTAAPRSPGGRDPRPLKEAIRALRRHIYLEEEFLFPPLSEAGLMAPVLVMLREHGQMWTTLGALEADLDAGAGDSALVLCRRLTVQLLHHNLKEEKILYTQADGVLTAPATERLRALIDSGDLPEGWVCRKAGA